MVNSYVFGSYPRTKLNNKRLLLAKHHGKKQIKHGRPRAGEIKYFTGVSSPYEEPVKAELVVDSGSQPLDESVNKVIELLRDRGVIGRDEIDARA